MREFLYYSKTAPTSGSGVKEDLMKSGRLDIAIHTVISSFFLSHALREDTKLHLIFGGPPDPQKHLELLPATTGKTGVDKIYLNKKDVASIIKKMLYKYKEGQKIDVFPGYTIEKKSFMHVLLELYNSGKELYFLDQKGKDIRGVKISKNPVFILGDHLGLTDKKEIKRLKQIAIPVSIGPKTYFASHTVAIVHNELDRREI